jgi:hypothetical protein
MMYLPFLKDPDMLSMGLHPLEPAQWIEPELDWQEFYRHKQHCITQQRAKVLQICPGSEAAQQELHDVMHAHLLRDHPGIYRIQGENIIHEPSDTCISSSPDLPPIAIAGLWVQDDLCLLEEKDEAYHLTAAFLCSPSYWHLEDKIGKSLDTIHDPVPGYQASLAQPVNFFFKKLKAGRPVWRANWTITAHPGLMQRLDPRTPGDVDHDPLWLRVERQTLTRLPQSGAICFTIRVHRYPLDDVMTSEENRAALKKAIRHLTPDQAAYKSLAPVRHRLP